MKKTLLYSLLACLVFLMMACDNSMSKEKTNASFNNPFLIGIINGKPLYRVVVEYNNGCRHYIYFFKDGGDVSINYDVHEGKYTRNEIIVLLNGKAVSTNYLENIK